MTGYVRGSGLLLVVLCGVGWGPGVAQAQEDARVFLRVVGDEAAAEAVERESVRFKDVVTRADVVFAGTVEMERVYAECRGELGVSAEVNRDCQLQAARRIFVEEIIEVEAEALREGHAYTLRFGVWDPGANAETCAGVLDVEAGSLRAAARAGLPQLAEVYLCKCRRVCEEDEAVRALHRTPPEPPARPCAGGRARSAATEGHCCWPGQGWSAEAGRCVGAPSGCPGALVVSGEGCVAAVASAADPRGLGDEGREAGPGPEGLAGREAGPGAEGLAVGPGPVVPWGLTSGDQQGWSALTWGLVGIASGTTLVISGVSLNLLAAGERGQIDPSAEGTTQVEAAALQDAADLYDAMGVAAWATGGAFIITGVVLLTLDDEDADPAPRLGVSVSPGAFSVQLEGQF